MFASSVRKISIAAILVCLLALMTCGCIMRSNNHEKETETSTANLIALTERQKEILASEGLPTELDELNSAEFDMIMKIEETLSLLEEKYGEPFTYIDYLNGEHNKYVVCCDASGVLVEAYLGLSPTRKFILYENYEESKLALNYQAEIKELFAGEVANVKVFVCPEKPWAVEPDKKTFAVDIMFNAEEVSKEKLQDLAKIYSEWVRAEVPEIYGDVDLRTFEPAAFEELDDSQREQFGAVLEKYPVVEKVSLDSDKDCSVHEADSEVVEENLKDSEEEE